MGQKKQASSRDHTNVEMVNYVIDGCSKSLLAKIFGLHRSTVIERLKGAAPDGTRGGSPIYKIANVAPTLLKLKDKDGAADGIDFDDPSTMPPDMRKDYWDARNKELKAKKDSSDLWDTEEVIQLASGAYKAFKLGVQLFSDTLARESELTERQRAIIEELSDDLLNDIRKRLVEDLSDDGDIQES